MKKQFSKRNCCKIFSFLTACLMVAGTAFSLSPKMAKADGEPWVYEFGEGDSAETYSVENEFDAWFDAIRYENGANSTEDWYKYGCIGMGLREDVTQEDNYVDLTALKSLNLQVRAVSGTYNRVDFGLIDKNGMMLLAEPRNMVDNVTKFEGYYISDGEPIVDYRVDGNEEGEGGFRGFMVYDRYGELQFTQESFYKGRPCAPDYDGVMSGDVAVDENYTTKDGLHTFDFENVAAAVVLIMNYEENVYDIGKITAVAEDGTRTVLFDPKDATETKVLPNWTEGEARRYKYMVDLPSDNYYVGHALGSINCSNVTGQTKTWDDFAAIVNGLSITKVSYVEYLGAPETPDEPTTGGSGSGTGTTTMDKKDDEGGCAGCAGSVSLSSVVLLSVAGLAFMAIKKRKQN